jgi:hypothetical protein
MEKRLEDLYLRFQNKGFMHIEIKGLMQDVFKTLGNRRYYNRTAVNQEMEDLGWGLNIMDRVTYELANSLA